MNGADGVLGQLQGVHQSGAGWMSQCPAHDDRKASLSIRRSAETGNLLLRCHAGCDFGTILAAIDVPPSACFPDQGPRAVETPKRLVATYPYRGEDGALRFEVLRYEPKAFRQRRPNPGGVGWIYTLDDVQRPLYRLPELRAAASAEVVVVVEGERDVDALEQHGFVATTAAGGASAKWLPQYSEALRGRNVVVIPDNDDPGRAHGEKIVAALVGVAASVRIATIPNLPPKGDVSTFFEQGGTPEELRRIIADAALLTPESLSQSLIGRDCGTRVVRAWEVAEPPPVTFLWDQLIPNGFSTSLFGDGGNGKSYLALALGSHVAAGRPFLGRAIEKGPVLYIDAELNDQVFLSRAYSVARGMQLERPPEGLHYLQLLGSLLDPGAQEECSREIANVRPRLVVVDSMTIAAPNADPNDAGQVASVMKVLGTFGTCLVIDHIAKPSPGANQSNFRQFGSVFKGNLARSAIQVIRAEGGGILLRQTKTNFGQPIEPIGVAIGFGPDAVYLNAVSVSDPRLAGIEDHLPPKERIYRALADGPATAQELADATEIPLKTVKNKLTGLKSEVRVTNSLGTWSIVEGEEGAP